MRITARFFIIILASLSLLQCSSEEDGDVEAISFSTSPEKPIVIPADFTYYVLLPGAEDPTKEVVLAPWFKFTYTIVNGSPFHITVQTIILKTTTVDVNGGIVSGQVELEPGDLAVNQNASIADDQTFLNSIAVGDSASLTNFIEALPQSSSGIYTLEGEIIGWFGTPTEPIRGFRKRIKMKTSGD